MIVGVFGFLLLGGTAFAKAPPTVKCNDGTTAPAGKGACSQNGGRAPLSQQEAGATAKCKDGTYWHSTAHSGACLHHHGVAKWYDNPL